MKVFNNSLFILAFLILAYSAFVPSTAAPASPEARAKAICGDLGILHITTLLDGVEPSGLRLYADYPMGQNRALDLRTEYLLHQWVRAIVRTPPLRTWSIRSPRELATMLPPTGARASGAGRRAVTTSSDARPLGLGRLELERVQDLAGL